MIMTASDEFRLVEIPASHRVAQMEGAEADRIGFNRRRKLSTPNMPRAHKRALDGSGTLARAGPRVIPTFCTKLKFGSTPATASAVMKAVSGLSKEKRPNEPGMISSEESGDENSMTVSPVA